ncbi:WD40-repeat-containing domain protein [Sphaerosporella brunnea]|uniref:WD40-repeat-containing domain protein n=1 Tax=Sphaerosporella brunnea TaxID=1250544 RepID=A0A5J5F595_9PEZI|nr:WD40-repeat-containing domain protein [Sphaerosporella brunnea]
MSLTRQSILAPQPTTTRASPTHLSVNPNGERIAYASGKSVFLRSIDDPSVSTQYTGHTAIVTVARFSPSGFYVASGDASGKVRVWDCVGEEMTTKGEFHIISGPIKDLAWDGESKRIIAVGDGKERFGHCITFDTGNSVGEITGQSSVINSVSIRAQRPFRAATASDDQTIVFYHGAPFKFNALLKGHHTNFVHGVAFSPDGAYFVSVGADRKIFLFDGKEGTLISEIIGPAGGGHKGSILSVSWSADSKRFVTASTDQSVKLWDAESQTLVTTWSFGSGPGSIQDHQVGIVWTPRSDGLIISLSLSGDLNYLRPDSSEPIRVVSGHQKPLTALEVTDSGKCFLTGSTDGRVCKWDLSTGIASVVRGDRHTNVVAGFLEVAPGTISSVAWDDKLRLISSSGGTFLSTPLATEGQPKGLARLSESTLVLLTASELRVYNLTPTPELTSTHKLPFTPTALAASPATGHIAVATQDNKIRIFTYSAAATSITENSAATITLSRSHATALSYSPDGAYFTAGDSAGMVPLFSTASTPYAKKTDRWAFHTGRIEDVAWNAVGTHVVTASLDTNVLIYGVEQPMKNAKLRNAHMGGVNRVRWVGENEVLSVGNDGAVKRWAVVLPGA